jgi:acyl-CoA synthetase (AMP-forming)/AMP-acid ligase II
MLVSTAPKSLLNSGRRPTRAPKEGEKQNRARDKNDTVPSRYSPCIPMAAPPKLANHISEALMSSCPATPFIRRASHSTVASMVSDRARSTPDRTALQAGQRICSFAELDERANRLAHALMEMGVDPGDRIAILSENRLEFIEATLAAGKIGAILACQNWRLAVPELQHCVGLVEPKLVLVSERHRATVDQLDIPGVSVLEFGREYEARLARAGPTMVLREVDPEAGLLILYTSGTTGLPKGALISHRAEVARATGARADFGVKAGDSFVCWTPMFHMGGMDLALMTLLGGGKVIIEDGYDATSLADIAIREPIGWLIVIPGMVESFIDEMKRRNQPPAGIRLCGVMADLVPGHQLAEITRLLDAPYSNTFGSTETGSLPAAGAPVPIGVIPTSLSKTPSPNCEMRLVDEDGNDVAPGTPGELAIRGPTLFSGYWKADETNAHDFRGGWFHNGDLLVRNEDGGFDFVDRLKYMIKSGGENIYPAEIERILLTDPRVTEAAVVRRHDDRWGEVPIAFVARSEPTLDDAQLATLCRANLAGFKQPKEIRFLDHDAFPRNISGKVLRHELEALL